MAKTVKDLKRDYEGYDFVAPFKEERSGNFLLQELDLFATSPSKSPSARVADIVESEAKELTQNDRYGTDTNSVVIDKATMYEAEIPVVHQTASIRPHDWQGKISAIDGKEMTISECIANRADRFNIDYKERVEKDLSMAIFQGKAEATLTDAGNIDFQAVTGKSPISQEIDFGALNTNELTTQFNKARRALNKELRGARSFVHGMIVFCGAELYDSIRTNAYNRELTQYNVAGAPKNAYTNQLIAGFEYFDWSNMRFLLIDDDRYELDEKAGLMLPKFSRTDVNPLRTIQGPCSRHQTVAQGGVQARYGWTRVDDHGMIHMEQEFSHLPLNLRPNFQMKLSIKEKKSK
ncbi:major capsid protein E [Serratia fonticola]|uniref:Major capsid protein E n=1 Tax=Serratia fonticola TaxID=47917 RepID=A0AAW3WRX6_SERFO|nr:major capsid protein E [Serratia fonticola]MBC3213571.1 major capsid protein E [Serratia fonticola]NYA11475.1 major capsid protein E [Serratia fonticola]NYA31379.1 major capsid protein E [Serratia fonticola]